MTARVCGAPRDGVIDLGGRTSLAALAEVLAGAQAAVVGNTGPAHLAAAVGCPVAWLHAPTLPAVRWHPWRVPFARLALPAPCEGCRARECPVARSPVPRPTPGQRRRRRSGDSGSNGITGLCGDVMRILIWHVHGAWTTSFVHGPHEYLVPRLADRGPDGRGRALTYSWPESAREIGPEEAASAPIDVVILQRPEELDGLAERWLGGRRPGIDLPAIYVEHNAPQGRINEMRHPAANHPELTLVHVTHFNALFWDAGTTPTRVIEHGVVDPGRRYVGDLARAAVVVNEPARRARVTGTDLLPAFGDEVPIDLFGIGAGALGGIEDLPQDRLHDEMARRRVYLHPVRWTSLGLSLIEAMHLGMPVVALATTEVAEAVPPGAGVVSNRLDVLRGALSELAGDPAAAAQMGAAARAGGHGALRVGALSQRLERAAGGGGGMRIDMVSEHASPLAALGGRGRGRAERPRGCARGRAGAPRSRGRRAHAARRPGAAGRGRDGARRDGQPRCRRPARAPAQGRAPPPHGRFRAPFASSGGAGGRPTWSTPTSGCRAWQR